MRMASVEAVMPQRIAIMREKFSAPPWHLMVSKPGRTWGRRGSVLVAAGGPMAIDCTDSGSTFQESAANGKLIAAAPGLALALRMLVRELEAGVASSQHAELRIAITRDRIGLLKELLRSAGLD
jgi:hypothetical protein